MRRALGNKLRSRGAVSALDPADRRERGAQFGKGGGPARAARQAGGRGAPPGRGPGARGGAPGLERRSGLSAALDRLPQRDRLVLECRYLLDLSEADGGRGRLRPRHGEIAHLAGARPAPQGACRGGGRCLTGPRSNATCGGSARRPPGPMRFDLAPAVIGRLAAEARQGPIGSCASGPCARWRWPCWPRCSSPGP